ncbi:gluconokinase [Vibrio maerlii]|uniref:gluconokinase n=1 Tax=Vibrio maerlii TaxID=2231648 RepID=UPI000E3B7F6E|nr:gluconokinase [Vibrio maerlii]
MSQLINNVLVMGVSGCGKTTVGQLVAEKLGIPFFDGDDFHPQENIDKMTQGIPLDDADRHGWLLKLNEQFITHSPCVIACSALKPAYRDLLKINNERLDVLYLKGDYQTILHRLEARSGHYFKGEAMLKSQYDTLVEPSDCEATILDIREDAWTLAEQVVLAKRSAA